MDLRTPSPHWSSREKAGLPLVDRGSLCRACQQFDGLQIDQAGWLELGLPKKELGMHESSNYI